MRGVSAGWLALDELVGRYLPPFAELPGWRRSRFGTCSSTARVSTTGAPLGAIARSPSPSAAPGSEQVRSLSASASSLCGPRRRPGSEVRYSDLGYLVLGAALEAAGGAPFGDASSPRSRHPPLAPEGRRFPSRRGLGAVPNAPGARRRRGDGGLPGGAARSCAGSSMTRTPTRWAVWLPTQACSRGAGRRGHVGRQLARRRAGTAQPAGTVGRARAHLLGCARGGASHPGPSAGSTRAPSAPRAGDHFGRRRRRPPRLHGLLRVDRARGGARRRPSHERPCTRPGTTRGCERCGPGLHDAIFAEFG